MILSYAQVKAQMYTWHQQHETVVFVTGVFDILHQEHNNFLHKASQQGNRLIVGLESDQRVTLLKGPTRPVNSITVRLNQINNLDCVSGCFELPPVTNWLHFMQELQPDSYCVSSHSPYLETKKSICEQIGIEFKIVHQHNPAISTTKIVHQNRQQVASAEKAE